MSIESLPHDCEGCRSDRFSWRSRRTLRGWVAAAGLMTLCLLLSMVPATPLSAQESTQDLPEIDASAGADLDAAREVLARSATPGMARDEEIALLVAQDRAARTLGDGARRLPILRRLVELSQGSPRHTQYLSFLWREEWRSGNQERAFAIGQQLLDESRDRGEGERAAIEAQLASDYLEAWQPARAQSSLAEGERLLEQYAARGHPIHLARVTAIVRQQQAVYAVYLGHYREALARLSEAEVAIRQSISETVREAGAADSLNYYQSDLSYERSIYGIHAQTLSITGRHVEAEVVVREGLQRSVDEGIHGAALAEWDLRLARVKLAERDYAAAGQAASRALNQFQSSGLAPSSQHVVWAHIARLESLIGDKRWSEAHNEYALMLTATTDDPLARRSFASSLTESLLLARDGQADRALEAIDKTVNFRRRIYGDTNPRTIEARAVRAIVLQARGDGDAALAAYHEVFAVLFGDENPFIDSVARGLRGFYLPLALESYLDLVAARAKGANLSAGAISDAFLVCDRLRDSRVQQAIVESASRSLVDGNDALAHQLRLLQDADGALRTSYENLVQRDVELGEARAAWRRLKDAGADTTEAGRHIKALEAEILPLRETVTRQEHDQSAARSDLVSRFPDYHRLVNPRPATPADVAARLAPDEAFVSIYSSDANTFTFVVTAHASAQLGVAPIGAAAIAREVAHLREAFDVAGRSQPPEFDALASYQLYHEILEPEVSALSASRSLIVAGSGALGQLPPALWVTSAPAAGSLHPAWLIEKFATAQVASAAALVSIRTGDARSKATAPFIGFGAPDFGTHPGPLAPLPETRDEVLAMARALGADATNSTYFGSAATRTAVLAAPLSSRRVVAFSTHGLKPGDLPALSQPALALAADATGPTLLTLDDVLHLKLASATVVLSACDTGSSDGRSAEAISGLGRGFFYAGGRLILLTHWEVESRSAQILVSDFFARVASGAGGASSPAAALRETQLALAESSEHPEYRHPFYWAAYALVGDAGAPSATP